MSDTIHNAFRRSNNCPEISQLFEAMEQDATDPRRRLAEEHMQVCPGCQTEWSMFKQFEAGEVRPEEREAVDFIVRTVRARRVAERKERVTLHSLWQRLWTPAWMGGAAVAMAALILTVGVVTQWRARHSTSEVFSDNQTLRSQSVEFTTPLRDITQAPTTIQWKPVPGANNYAVTLNEVDGTRIFYTNVTSTLLSLPDDTRKLLTQGRVLLLSVTASDASAREIARSGMVRIRVSSNATGTK
jgi:hypothetical protein